MATTEGKARKKGKKNRKHGRNAIKCARYKAQNRKVKNKKCRLLKHCKHHENDAQAREVLEKL